MNKREVAAFLNISDRGVNRYSARGLLNPTYHRLENGSLEAIYDEAEVKALRKKSKQAVGALIRTKSQSEGLTLPPAPNLQTLLEELAKKIASPVPLSEKYTLTLTEAVRLSGVSESLIRKALRDGTLQGSKAWGRGWRVRRTDLKAWTDTLDPLPE